jgi:hypothetical protein
MNPAPYVGMKLKFIKKDSSRYKTLNPLDWIIEFINFESDRITIEANDNFNIFVVRTEHIWDYFSVVSPINNNDEEML